MIRPANRPVSPELGRREDRLEPASSPGARSRGRRVIGRVLLVVAVAAMTLFFLELAFRGYALVKYRNAIAAWSSHPLYRLTPDKPYVYVLKPHASRVNRIRGDANATWSYTTNNFGLRGRRDISERADPGITRVVALGDSYTFGWAVNDDEPFPVLIEAQLTQRWPAKRFEVINAGIPGYNTAQEFELLRDVLIRLRPNLVLIGYVPNDAEPQHTVPASPAVTYRYASSWLWEELKRLVTVAIPSTKTIVSPRAYVHTFEYRDGFRQESPKWKESQAALEGIARFCRTQGVELFLFILPDFTQDFDASYRFKRIHEVVGHWGRDLDIATTDLLPFFLNEDHTEYWVPRDEHPNAKAHRKIARIIVDQLQHHADWSQQRRPRRG